MQWRARFTGVLLTVTLLGLPALAARPVPITEGSEPAVSPDGEHFAFVRWSSGQADIYVARLDGSDVRRVTKDPAQDSQPAWSPDGRFIVFSSRRSGGRDLYVLDVSGQTPPRRLTDLPGQELEPDWSPDGKLIVFTVVDKRKMSLGIVPAAGGAVELYDPVRRAEESDACWLPSGARLAVVLDSDGRGELGVLRIDQENGLAEVELEMPFSAELEPACNPVDGRIAFTSNDDATPGLFDEDEKRALKHFRKIPKPEIAPDQPRYIHLVGKGLFSTSRQTKKPYSWEHPAWTPDGRSLLAVRLGRMKGARFAPEEQPVIYLLRGIYRPEKTGSDKERK